MPIDWKEIPEVRGMGAGSARKSVCGDLMSAVLVTTEPGTEFDGKTHWHDNEQMLIMVSGMIRLVVDGEEFDAHPGDLVFFPPARATPPSAAVPKAASTPSCSPPPGPTSSRAGSAGACCGSTEPNRRGA